MLVMFPGFSLSQICPAQTARALTRLYGRSSASSGHKWRSSVMRTRMREKRLRGSVPTVHFCPGCTLVFLFPFVHVLRHHITHLTPLLFCSVLTWHCTLSFFWNDTVSYKIPAIWNIPSMILERCDFIANGANCSSYNKKLIIIKMSLQLVDWYRFSMLEMLFFPLQMTYSKLNTIKRFCNYLLILMSFQILMTFIVLWNTKADILWLCWPLFFMQLLLMSFEWMLKGKLLIFFFLWCVFIT